MIQQVLRTYPLESARPRNRLECRLRVRQTRRYNEVAAGRRANSPDKSSLFSHTLEECKDNDSQEVASIGLIPSIAPDFVTLSELSDTGVETFTRTLPFDGGSGSSVLDPLDHDIDLPDIHDNFTGLQNQISSPALFVEGLTPPNVLLPHVDPCSTTFDAGVLASDHSLMYPQDCGENSRGQSSHTPVEFDAGTLLRPPDSSRAIVPQLRDPKHPPFIDPVLPETNFSLPSNASDSLRDSRRPYVAKTASESNNGSSTGAKHKLRPKRSHSWAKTLGSLKERLSYSSSQMSDIMAAFGYLSMSTDSTKFSTALDSLENLNSTNSERPREVSSDVLHSMNYPIGLPGQLINTDVDVSRFEPCGFLLSPYSQNCDRCFEAASFHTFISEYQLFKMPWRDPAYLEIGPQDRFNNTALHIAAAIGADCHSLSILIQRGASSDQVNTAGETFLHLMDTTKFLDKAGEIPGLLANLSRYGHDFSKVDCQGSNGIQALLRQPLEVSTIQQILEAVHSHLPVLESRDNLGRTLQSQLLFLAQISIETDPERAKSINDIVWRFFGPGCFNYINGNFAFDKVPTIACQEDRNRLQGLITYAHDNALIEDDYGRNALHCLAEPTLHFAIPGARLPNKGSHSTSHDLARRHFLERLIKEGVPVNAYDKAGNTPLLAFVQSVHDGVEGKINGQIGFYISKLVKSGANINARNRNGESTLHIAIKRGLLTATRLLISLGANLHARQKDGMGIVQFGVNSANISKKHKSLHIRIMTCVNIARERGALDHPTVFDEWDAPTRSVNSRNAPTSDTLGSPLSEHPLFYSEDWLTPGELPSNPSLLDTVIE